MVLTALMLYGLIRVYGNRLMHSNRRIAEVLESISDGFFALDEDLVVTYFNNAAERLLGRKSADLLGRKLFEAFPEAKGSVFEEQYARALKEKKFVTFETYFGIKPYENWYEVRVYPLDKGIAVYFQVTTERKRAEKALRESEYLQRAILNNIPDMAWLKDAQGKYIAVNEAFAASSGKPAGEIVGRTDVDLWAEAGRKYQAGDLRVMQSGSREIIEETFVDSTGNTLWLETIKTPLYNDRGDVVGTAGIARDISDRKIVQERTLKERDFSKAALDSLPGIVYVFDSEGRFLRWNNNLELVSEYSSEEISSMSPLDFFIGPDKFMIQEKIQEAFERGAADAEADFITKSGKHKPYYYTGRIIQVEGKPCLIGMGIDITDRKRTDEALRKSEEHFRRLTEQSPVPIALSNERKEIEYVNEQFVRTFGYTRDDIPNIDAWFVRAYPDPGYRSEVIAIWGQAVKTAIQQRSVIAAHEYRVTCKDGTIRTVEIFGSLIGTREQVIFNDVTERKRAEAAISESRERFKNLVEASSDWVWEMDEHGVYTYASPKVSDILGYEPAEVLGKTPFDLMPPDEAERVSKFSKRSLPLKSRSRCSKMSTSTRMAAWWSWKRAASLSSTVPEA